MRLGGAVVSFAAAVASWLVPADALAKDDYPAGFAVERFEPAERGSDWFSAESLDYRGVVRPTFGVTADYAYRPFVVLAPGGDVRASIVRNVAFAHAGASVVLFERLRLGLDLPVQVGVDGHTAVVTRSGGRTVFLPPPGDGGVGDFRMGADARLFGSYRAPVSMAIGLQAWAPSGREAQYAGDGEWRLRPRAIVAGDLARFAYSAQLAYTYRAREETLGVGSIGSEVNVTLGAGVRLLDDKLLVGPELWAGTVLRDAFERKTTPIEGALGAHYLAFESLRVGAGVSAGFTRSYGAPVSRAILGVEWAPAAIEDRDQDGVKNAEDACPDVRGVRSADPARNGCPPPPPPSPAPPPPDRDHDGVPDSADACPDTPGVKTDDPRTSGCKDTDGDGAFDPVDACVDEKGIASADPKANGCPDEDDDGIADKDDACPTIAGVHDPDRQKNGCPANFDRDHDGITNNVDACPDDPGPRSTDPLKNGCPTAFVSAGQIKILEQVQFKTGSAKIETTPETLAVLHAIEKVLREHPEIKRVRVEGYTDDVGSAAANKRLSSARAEAVMNWLASAGIARKRLTSAGFGAANPIDTNDTEQGRKANRRVELHIQ
jgi:outer membrane protein OmpA-like peptidoglycan-associated protein